VDAVFLEWDQQVSDEKGSKNHFPHYLKGSEKRIDLKEVKFTSHINCSHFGAKCHKIPPPQTKRKRSMGIREL
jgi:hypothetical protein